MSIKTVPRSQMVGSKIIRRMDNSIFSLIEKGVEIIRNGVIVNQEEYDKYMNRIIDEQEAAKALMYEQKDAEKETLEKQVSNEESQKNNSDRISIVENDVKNINSKLDRLLGLLEK